MDIKRSACGAVAANQKVSLWSVPKQNMGKTLKKRAFAKGQILSNGRFRDVQKKIKKV